MNPNELSVAARWWALPVLVLLMLLLLVDLRVPSPAEGAVHHLWNLLHAPLFVVVTWLLSRLPVRCSRAGCMILAALLAVGTEVAQWWSARTPSMEDLCADFSGIALAMALMGPRRWRLRGLLLLAAAGLLVPALLPWVADARAVHARRVAFPSLLVPGHPAAAWSAQGGTSLEVVKRIDGGAGRGLLVATAGGSYEGLRYPLPEGVAAGEFDRLRLECVNPGGPFVLGVRIDGDGGLRQSSSVVVPSGHALLEAGWSPSASTAQLVRVVLFTGEQQPARRFQLIAVKLLRRGPGGP